MPRALPFAAAALSAAAILVSCADPSDPGTDAPSLDAVTAAGETPQARSQNSGTTNSLVGLDAVTPDVVWASGAGGTFLVTTDGGRHWRSGVVPGAEALAFRDVHGFSADVAYLLSIGNGNDSRIYKTEDGGRTWDLQFKNQIVPAFYDCFDFWSEDRGVVFSDAVDGRFPVRRTRNGETWPLIADRLPEALPGEAAFAASGTCVETRGEDRAWIVTGGAERARVLATFDGGDTWDAFDTPIVAGGAGASGGTSIRFRDRQHGIIVGGDILDPKVNFKNVAYSDDGGRTWRLRRHTPFPGAAYGASYVGGRLERTVVATGPGGVAYSHDEGLNWELVPGLEGFWSVDFTGPQSGWVVGTGGRIAKLSF